MFNKKITIIVEDVKMSAELNSSETAQKIWEALPIEASGKVSLPRSISVKSC